MHRYVHSVNEVSDVDREGYRTLKLRNLSMVEHVDTVIRGDKVRKWLIAAACRCNWVHQFIKNRIKNIRERFSKRRAMFLYRILPMVCWRICLSYQHSK